MHSEIYQTFLLGHCYSILNLFSNCHVLFFFSHNNCISFLLPSIKWFKMANVTSKQSREIKTRKLTKHARSKGQTRKPDQTCGAIEKDSKLPWEAASTVMGGTQYRVKRWRLCQRATYPCRGTRAGATESLGAWPPAGAGTQSSTAGMSQRLGWGGSGTTVHCCHSQEKPCKSWTKWSNGKNEESGKDRKMSI